jgi:hypothetical protein
MLPRIDSKNWPELPHHWVLVCIRPNLHTPRLHILDQPRPPTPLNARERAIELLLERVQATIAVVDRLGQRTTWRLAAALAGGREVLPEQAVVDVSAAVEVDHGLQGDLRGNVLLVLCFGDLLAEVVERRYVGVVVVFVVEFHDFARDGGLEGAVVICGHELDRIGRFIGRGRRTWEVGQSGFSTHECGACETCAGDGGSGGPCGGAQGGCTEECGVHGAGNRCGVVNRAVVDV